MDSLWRDGVTMPEYRALRGDERADVLVIGGGMAGLLCARLLTDAGIDCALLEADRICRGVTKNTTAKITALHGLRCGKIIDRYGLETARQYYSANMSAVERYAAMCRGADCGFERQDAYVYSRVDRESIEREAGVLRCVGVQAELTDRLDLPFEALGVRVSHQAQFHPLKFAARIARGLRIYEHSPVLSLKGNTARTPKGSITAGKIIVATHFPFINRHGSYFLKLYQSRSYVIALEKAPELKGMYLDDSPGGLSFRRYGDFLLMGGQSHRTGEPGGGWAALEETAARLFPGAKAKYRWATQDCMTLDGIPYIGNYSALTPDWYVAAGFNKWGMTSSMVAAELLTGLILGRAPAQARVFSPSRSMLTPQLAANIAHSAKDILTLSRPRCPHLGCALKWNAAEHTWDCPCHGSRFDEHGRLLDNPSQRPMKPR